MTDEEGTVLAEWVGDNRQGTIRFTDALNAMSNEDQLVSLLSLGAAAIGYFLIAVGGPKDEAELEAAIASSVKTAMKEGKGLMAQWEKDHPEATVQ